MLAGVGIIDTKRRRFLSVAAGGAAAIPAAALADAPAVDPIFAAIDEHKKASAAHLAAIYELNRLEKIDSETAKRIGASRKSRATTRSRRSVFWS